MKLMLKRLGLVLGVLVIVLVVGILLLVLLVDPDMFKPRIEAAARQQNVELTIDGDMSWQLWPSLGIEINDVRAATTAAPQQPIARLGQASLLVAVMPLLRGEVFVDHVLVDGAAVDLVVNEEGQGNWDALFTGKPAAEEPAPEADDGPARELKLQVERITVRNSSLNYTSHANPPEAPDQANGAQRLSIQNIRLDVEGFNLQGQPFATKLQWLSEFSDSSLSPEAVTITGQLAQQVQLSPAMDELAISDAYILLAVSGSEQSSEIEVSYQVTVQDLQESPRYSGEFEIAPLDVKQLLSALGQQPPPTTNAAALTSLSATGNFTGSTNTVALTPFSFRLDDTRLNGSASVTGFDNPAFELQVEGDSFNLDHYLPPPETTPETVSTTGDEELIPIEAIRPLVANVSFDLEQLTVANMPLTQVRLRLTAKDGLISIERAAASAYEGTFAATGQLDARGETSTIAFNGALDGLQLAPLLRDQALDENIKLTGAVQAAIDGQARGVTLNQLRQSARGEATFTGDEIRIAPLNVEEKFCQITDLVTQRQTADKDWPDFTEMHQVSGTATLADQTITLEQMTAGVAHLAVGVEGTIDIGEGDYDFRLPLTLTNTRTSEQGCLVQSDYWLDRNLNLLRCRGSLEGLNPVDDCRPDAKGLASLVKDFATFQLKEKHGDKIDAAESQVEEKKEELREKLEDKMGGDDGKKVEQRLKDLLKR